MEGKYLYCVLKQREPRKFDIQGIDGRKVYTINEAGLAMIVSDTPPKKEYEFIRENIDPHIRVIEEVMRKGYYDVLPVRFATVTKNAEHIKKILKEKRKEILEKFKTIEGKLELSLKALWIDMPTVFQEIVASSSEIRRAKKQVQKNPVQLKMAGVGELVKKALEAKREEEAKGIVQLLKQLAVDFKERKLLGDSMICNHAFLVPKDKEKEFDQRVGEIVERNKQRIKFIYLGPPIPPYNFVTLHINL